MPMPFIETRFPENISYGSKGGPGFKTTVFEAQSGSEQRNSEWAKARARYNVAHGIKDRQDMDALLEFFYVMRAKATGFRYKDWADFKLTNGIIDVGDGTKTAFQIIKVYTVDTATYTREIRKPVAGTFTVTVGGAAMTPVTDYTVDTTTGIITFTVPPSTSSVIRVSCEFDVPVRFDTDTMEITQEAWELQSWGDIPLVEIRPYA